MEVFGWWWETGWISGSGGGGGWKETENVSYEAPAV